MIQQKHKVYIILRSKRETLNYSMYGNTGVWCILWKERRHALT